MLGILVAFSGSTYGEIDAEGTIYSRGTGQVYFSILNYCLWGLVLAFAFRSTLSRVRRPHTPLAKYFLFFLFLIFANALVAGFSSGSSVDVIDAFSYSGLLNIINMGAFFYVCINAYATRPSSHLLSNFILVAIGLRGLFGVARLVFFGGDSANIYANFENTGTSITFFDISDGFLATLAAFSSAWLLYFNKSFIGRRKRCALWILLILEVAIVVLSFRRSSLIGMGLSAVLLISVLPLKKRLSAMFFSLCVLFGGASLLTALRLDKVDRSGGSNGFLFDVLGGSDGAESGSRILEYTETWRSLGDDWIFGKGMWGTMQSNLAELSYHDGNFGFVHSGFGHVLLKSGVLGLAMFIGLLSSFFFFYIRTRKNLVGELRMLADAGAAGVLFWLPTLLIGTPIIEFRSMMMMGLALALPFIAGRASAIRKRSYVVA